MTKRDSVLTPELVKILKIFILSSLGLVLALSFFNEYRANNSGEDRTFRVNDSNRLYFLNVRAIHYDREIRRDAGMTLYRNGKRTQSDSSPTLDLVILLNSGKENAYIYFELKNAEWPIRISAKTAKKTQVFDFSNGNNADHYSMLEKLKPAILENAEFELISEGKTFPIWSKEMEKEAVKTVLEDYFRLLNQTN
ncbi:hypothetical protein [Algoriphagus sp.]|uniref:hypothetical protein n=1 Tax=Algoriphagus sp. TaxID=1872435 RepID=UPI00391C9325